MLRIGADALRGFLQGQALGLGDFLPGLVESSRAPDVVERIVADLREQLGQTIAV